MSYNQILEPNASAILFLNYSFLDGLLSEPAEAFP